MNKGVLIVKNISREGPGLLEEVLNGKGITSTLIDLDEGDELPDPSEFSAVFVLGGPDSANDETSKMKKELGWIQQVLEKKIPYLGICLGLQTLVKVSGGTVVKNAVREIGFRDVEENPFSIELTEEGKQDALFEGLGDFFQVFHLHGETVIPTKKMTLLGQGKWCKNQVIKVAEKAYGIQCHFELTEAMFEVWLSEDDDLKKLDRNELKADFDKLKNQYTHTGLQLFENFLKIANI